MDPKAKPNLVVEEIQDETLVYNLDQHRAHCLNGTAGFLLRSADGTRSVAELAALAEQEFGDAVSEAVVDLGLERLHKAGLLEWDAAHRQADRVSRRQMLKKVAAVGLLLPTVMTLVSPFPAQAATQLANNNCNIANLGKCCSKGKLCLQNKKGQYKCGGPQC